MFPQQLRPCRDSDSWREWRSHLNRRALAGRALQLKRRKDRLRPSAHTPDTEALHCVVGNEPRTVILDLKPRGILAIVEPNSQNRGFGVANGIGNRLLAHAEERVCNAQGDGARLPGSLGDDAY